MAAVAAAASGQQRLSRPVAIHKRREHVICLWFLPSPFRASPSPFSSTNQVAQPARNLLLIISFHILPITTYSIAARMSAVSLTNQSRLRLARGVSW